MLLIMSKGVMTYAILGGGITMSFNEMSFNLYCGTIGYNGLSISYCKNIIETLSKRETKTKQRRIVIKRRRINTAKGHASDCNADASGHS